MRSRRKNLNDIEEDSFTFRMTPQYYCPHHPEYGQGVYKQDCECRKPKPGMFISAKEFLDIDMEKSVMVGDKAEDIMAATAAGVGTTILVRTGKPVTEKGQALAGVVLDSIADVPSYLTR